MRTAHGQGFLMSHGLSSQVAQGKIDGFGLGPYAEAIHDCLEVGVFDLDVRPNSAHTSIVHVTCIERV